MAQLKLEDENYELNLISDIFRCNFNKPLSLSRYYAYQLGMAQGVPWSSFPEVLDLFSLPDSPRNRFYHSSAPRGPRQNSQRTSKIQKVQFCIKNERFANNLFFPCRYAFSNFEHSMVS